MQISERIRMKGWVRFTVVENGEIVSMEIVDNLIVNGWLNRTRDAHMTDTDLTIRYLAWGDGVTAPAVTQTALVAEIGRKQVTQKVAGGAGVLTVTTYIAPGEANTDLEEWALLGGDEGSLTMVSRTLWSHTKTAQESLQLDWSISWSEV